MTQSVGGINFGPSSFSHDHRDIKRDMDDLKKRVKSLEEANQELRARLDKLEKGPA